MAMNEEHVSASAVILHLTILEYVWPQHLAEYNYCPWVLSLNESICVCNAPRTAQATQ